MSDLVVKPKYLEGLAEEQDQAVKDIAPAVSGPDGSAKNLWYDHGLICGATAAKMQQAESDREDACAKLAEVSTALAANLREAAAKYGKTDDRTGDNLNKQML